MPPEINAAPAETATHPAPKHQEEWLDRWSENFDTEVQRCTRCVYDANTPSITFDDAGTCNYCHLHDKLEARYPIGAEGQARLKEIVDKIKRRGRRKKYDVVVGVSGGCDSSFLLAKAVEYGLRPLAVHYDNTWNSTIATENIHNVLKALDVELYTEVVDNEEVDDIFRSFFQAGVIELDGPTDIALTAVHYKAALEHGIKYVFEGHSFRTEGVSPLGWSYVDGKYIQSIQSQFGTRKIRSFPNLTFLFQMRCMVLGRIKRLRPLWYIDYHKEDAKRFLSENLGWQWYGGHHLENRMTAFAHTYWIPRGFGMDQRANGYSALARSGQMERDEAIECLRQPPNVDFGLVELFKKRLGITDEEFERVLEMPKKTWKDYRTYKPLFEKLRPMFWLLSEMDLVPKSFYMKYTSKEKR